MNSEDVSGLVLGQIAGRESLPNYHGVDLSRCLVPPRRMQVINRSVRNGVCEDSTETAWLVLEEEPGRKNGYKIVFSEQIGMFGLATRGFESDAHPVLCGYYGDFPTTLEAM
jgi:hypothetical protein